MIQFKALDNQHEWEWFKGRTHVIQCEDSQGIVAVSAEGNILAICVADSFSPDSCNVHMAIDNPIVIRSGFLSECGRHLFHHLKRNHIFGLVPSNNARALKFNKHIGWREVARIPDGVGTGTDYVILRMDKAECRWIDQPAKEEAA